MAYATRADMVLAFGPAHVQQLTDNGEPPLGAINDAVLNRALDDASAWIDGYLAGRYATPVTEPTVVPLLRAHCCTVARYNLMTQHVDEAATEAYKASQRYFMAVGKGDINLMQPASAPAPDGVGSVEFYPGTKHFGRETSWRDC